MPLVLFLLSLLLLAVPPGRTEEFSGEAYRIGTSVVTNGTSGAVPSRFHTATQYLDFPGDIGPARHFRLEMATLPAFADLSQNVNGALAYSLDDKTRINVFGGMITTPDIPVLPVLSGTTEERLNDPGRRPLACEGSCSYLKDVVYQANINLMRAYRGHFPRMMGVGSLPIPMEFSAGVTTKYFYEELEGGGYEAQNMNVDVGTALRFDWGHDPVTRISDRNVKLQLSGFELLPTRQKAEVNGFEVYERLDYRWSFSLAWEEGIPSLRSFATLGITQKSDGGRWPALGGEWDFHNLLFLRGGWDGTYLSAGATAFWRLLSVHYAIRHHELGTSLYQVSLQLELR